jgi:predicted metal-dependent HD superfamily phosphohydrolase
MALLDAPESPDVFSALVTAYSEPHRHYHTAGHIDDCLARLDEAAAIADSPAEVELALWFHDAVYKPASAKNEQKSAEWARKFLQSVGAAEDRCARVFRYVMATRHDADAPEGDATVVVDIDLSILGRAPEVYDQFEQNVRKEYKRVPWPLYRRKRIEILKSFLARRTIYHTDHFRRRYEEQARDNLRAAIESLGK